MKNFLLVDFGASKIKAAHLIDGMIKNVHCYSSIAPCINKNKRFEISCLDIKNKFIEIVEQYYKKNSFQGVLVCSEMHGFVIVDKRNKALSNYISWKTERCTNINDNKATSSFNKLRSFITDKIFLIKTGMKPRACYPIFNIYDMIQTGEYVSGKVISLPEWLCCCGGKSENKSHVTMSAGLGFYNIQKNKFDEDLISFMERQICFNDVVTNVVVGGYITVSGKEIPIYTGVGDHQCAVLGAGNTEDTISVNLGTGSQIAIINLNNDKCEKVPYFEHKNLSVIKHIPSGRMLNCFVNFFKSINSKIDFWNIIDGLKIEDILEADLHMNLSIFESAWNYTNGGIITGITEENFTKKNFFASILKNYVYQYKKAIEQLSPNKKFNKIVLSGGIPSRIPVIKEYLSLLTGYDVLYNSKVYDETLFGLKIISNKYI